MYLYTNFSNFFKIKSLHTLRKRVCQRNMIDLRSNWYGTARIDHYGITDSNKMQ